ncbi:MAG: hypothetical protein EBT03_09975 [Betaproteobacteria bacterium]|nr:hypothetical protein [Betaproteobacteria bacterium]
MEQVKKLGVTRTLPLVRMGYRLRKYETQNYNYSWMVEREVKNFIAVNPGISELMAKDFIDWVKDNVHEVELWLVTKSPSNAAKLAVSWGKTRIHPEAEKILLEKAKDKIGLLQYCTKFGIIIPDSSKVTLKAAFSDDSWREKEYVKKIEETKRNLKSFITQMVGLGHIREDQTISEVLEIL